MFSLQVGCYVDIAIIYINVKEVHDYDKEFNNQRAVVQPFAQIKQNLIKIVKFFSNIISLFEHLCNYLL